MSPLLSTRQAADVIGVSPRTLELWRRTGAGPEFVRVSANRCMYEPASIEAFVASRRRKSTTTSSEALAERGEG